MISILKQPYECSFSKNSIDFKVQTNMYWKSAFIYPSITIQLNNMVDTHKNYRIRWRNPVTLELEDVNFLSVDGSDPDNYAENWQIPDDQFTGTLAAYGEIILQKILDTPLLNAWYTITTGTNTIILTAKEPVEELIPTWYTNQLDDAITVTILNGCYEPESRNGYYLRAIVFFEKKYLSGNFEQIAELPMVIDNDSSSIIDLSDILNGEIENSWEQYPIPDPEVLAYKSPNLFRYYVKFVESWIGERMLQNAISDTLLVHWGGISKDDELMADAVSINSNSYNFLTWWGSGKRIGIDQPDWLGWMNHFSFDEFEICVKIQTNIGITEQVIHTIKLNKFETVIFNTGYAANELESLVPGETIAHWTWYIRRGDDYFPAFRYYKETACIRKTILGFNSFGIPDTFSTSGEWTETMNISQTLAVRSASFTLNPLFPGNFIFSSKHQNTIKATTSMLSQKDALQLQSLINSMISFVWEFNRWFPVVMNTSSTAVYQLNAFLVQVELEIIKANENDRASFYSLQPDVIPFIDNGVEYFELIMNQLPIIDFGQIDIYSNNSTIVATYNWNSTAKQYENSTGFPFINEGEFMYKLSVQTADNTYNIIKHFTYKLKQITAEFYGLGTIAFDIKAIASSGISQLTVDFGDGTVQSYFYTGSSVVAISHTYSTDEKHVIRFSASTFDKLATFIIYGNAGTVDLSAAHNLEEFKYQSGPAQNFYFSQFSTLKTISVMSTQITGITIGYQQELISIMLDDTNISSDQLDELMLELWNFRKLYNNAVSLYFTSLGFTPSTYFNTIKNGTGNFAGEGLVANYLWTIYTS